MDHNRLPSRPGPGRGARALPWAAALIALSLAGCGGGSSNGATGGGGPPEEFAAFIAQQQKVWSEIVKRAGIKPD